MKKILILILILTGNLNAECTKKDLTDPEYLRAKGKANLIEHFQKPTDQDSVGWCGAYASADSLAFAVGEPVSSIDVSINYYSNNNVFDSTNLDKLQSIYLDSAATMAKVQGYCPESVIPSNQASSSNLGHSAIIKLMSSFQKIYDNYKSNGQFLEECPTCREDYVKIIMPSLPGVTEDMIKNVLLKNHKDSKDFFADLLDKLCEGKRKKFNPTVDRFPRMKLLTTSVSRVLDEALDSDFIPTIQMNTSEFTDPRSVPGGNGEHGMIIVARQMGSNNKCEYLVRNSWGKGCAYYQQKIKDKCDPAKGSFWMDEDHLQRAVQNVVVIKNDLINQTPSYVLQSKPQNNSLFSASRKAETNINAISNTEDSKTVSIPNVKNDQEKIATSSTPPRKRFSNFFRSIWKSLSKAFRY